MSGLGPRPGHHVIFTYNVFLDLSSQWLFPQNFLTVGDYVGLFVAVMHNPGGLLKGEGPFWFPVPIVLHCGSVVSQDIR